MMAFSLVAMVVFATIVTGNNQILPENKMEIVPTNLDITDYDSMDQEEIYRGLDLNNEINVNPDTCAQLNQVQSVVIQLLGSHFESSKTMEILTSLSDSVQKDILSIKSQIDSLDMSRVTMDEEINELASNQSALMEMLSDLNETNMTNPSSRSSKEGNLATQSNLILSDSDNAFNFQSKIANLTKTVTLQTKAMADLQRRTHRMRRSLSRVEQKLDKVVSARQNETMERIMVSHFMEKQKDINGDMRSSIRYLEAHLKQMLQRDSPQVETNGCPGDFVRHYMSCYRFLNMTLNWVDAEKHCQALHLRSHLIGLETPEEEDFIIKFRNYNNVPWTSMYIWTGATDMGKESAWSWVGTNKPLSYTNWRPGQPDNHNNNWQNCIYMRTDGQDNQWDDWHCHAARINFVCEINLKA